MAKKNDSASKTVAEAVNEKIEEATTPVREPKTEPLEGGLGTGTWYVMQVGGNGFVYVLAIDESTALTICKLVFINKPIGKVGYAKSIPNAGAKRVVQVPCPSIESDIAIEGKDADELKRRGGLNYIVR